jgi:teichuronic acid exporter
VLRPRRDELHGVLPFTFDTILGRLCWYVYQDADFVMAGRRLSDAATGAYSYAWALASAPLEKITSLATQITPSFLSEVQGDRGKLVRYFLAMTQAIALATFPLSIGLALTAQDLVPLVLGEKWLAAIGPLQVIAAYAGARAVTPFANQVLVAVRDTRYGFWLNAVAALLLPIGFLVGSRWGTVGIALAWVVLHPVAVIAPLIRRVSTKLGMPVAEWLRALWPALSSTAVMTLVVLSVQGALAGAPPVARLAAAAGTGALAYGGALLVFHRRRVDQLRRAIAAIRGR